MMNKLSHREVYEEARKYFNKGRKKDTLKFLFSKNKKNLNQMGGSKVKWGELKIKETIEISDLPQSQKKFINKLNSLSYEELNNIRHQLKLEPVEKIEEMRKNIVNKRIDDILQGNNIWSI